MSLDARDFRVAGQWAKAASTNIPPIPVSGQAYRRSGMTRAEAETGTPYDAVWESAANNEKDFETTGMALECETYGWPRWSPLTRYVGDASFCIGTDGVPYRAIQDSGADTLAGPVDPVTDTAGEYWLTLSKYLRGGGGGSAGGGGGSGQPGENGSGSDGAIIYPSGFFDFMEQVPPPGWRVRNGQLITNASSIVPELHDALQWPENTWKLRTQAQWSSLSSTAGGVGGVPFFVLDLTANTIRLPDTRGDYHRDSNGGTMGNPGAWHGDAIRNFTGYFSGDNELCGTGYGAFRNYGRWCPVGWARGSSNDGDWGTMEFNPSLVTLTAGENRTRAHGRLGCVYVGSPT